MLLKALTCVIFGTTVIAAFVFIGFFNEVNVDLGYAHYAEKPFWLGPWMALPANTFINGGYVIIGLYWLLKVYLENISDSLQFYFFVFNWMAILYGPVQLMRILTQKTEWAILDQWYTLPFFCLALSMECTPNIFAN